MFTNIFLHQQNASASFGYTSVALELQKLSISIYYIKIECFKGKTIFCVFLYFYKITIKNKKIYLWWLRHNRA